MQVVCQPHPVDISCTGGSSASRLLFRPFLSAPVQRGSGRVYSRMGLVMMRAGSTCAWSCPPPFCQAMVELTL